MNLSINLLLCHQRCQYRVSWLYSRYEELKGAALDKFMLQKKGKRWDGVPVPHVSVSDLKQETIDFFKKRGIKSQHISEEILTDIISIMKNT